MCDIRQILKLHLSDTVSSTISESSRPGTKSYMNRFAGLTTVAFLFMGCSSQPPPPDPAESLLALTASESLSGVASPFKPGGATNRTEQADSKQNPEVVGREGEVP
jgi:hypothetical protein